MAHRQSGRPVAAARRRALPRRRHHQPGRHAPPRARSTGRAPTRGDAGTATASRTSPRCTGPTTRLTITVQSRDQRVSRCWSSTPPTGTTTTLFADHDEAWVELVPGTGVMVGARHARDVRRSRWCAPADRQWRAGHAGRPAGAADRRRRCRSRDRSPPTRSTTPPCSTCTDGHRRAGSAHRRSRRPSRGRQWRRRRACARPRSTSRAARWRLPDGGQLDRHAERPLVQPRVTLLPTPDRDRAPPCCSRPSTTAGRCRCCSIRTAARTPSACCAATTPS